MNTPLTIGGFFMALAIIGFILFLIAAINHGKPGGGV